MALLTTSAHANEPEAPATEVAPTPAEPETPAAAEAPDAAGAASETPASDPAGGFGASPDDELDDDDEDEFEDESSASLGPPVSREAMPVPPAPPRPRRGEKSGRGMLIAGATLLGLGTAMRAGIEGFWAGPAALEAGEPFGQWSIPSIVFFTGFANLMVVPGLALTGAGARRRGRWRHDRGLADPDRTRLRWRVGWGLLGGGLATWAVTRAVGVPVLRSCETNGCAYGYVETTQWASLGLAVPGVILVGLAAGERGRRPRRVSAAPMLSPRTAGLSLGGRF